MTLNSVFKVTEVEDIYIYFFKYGKLVVGCRCILSLKDLSSKNKCIRFRGTYVSSL